MTKSVLALTQQSREKNVFEAHAVKERAVSIDKVVGHAGIHRTCMKDGCKVVLQLMRTLSGMLVAIYLASAFVSWSWQSDQLTRRFSTASHTLLHLSELFPRTLGAPGEIWNVVEAVTNFFYLTSTIAIDSDNLYIL